MQPHRQHRRIQVQHRVGVHKKNGAEETVKRDAAQHCAPQIHAPWTLASRFSGARWLLLNKRNNGGCFLQLRAGWCRSGGEIAVEKHAKHGERGEVAEEEQALQDGENWAQENHGWTRSADWERGMLLLLLLLSNADCHSIQVSYGSLSLLSLCFVLSHCSGCCLESGSLGLATLRR